MYNWTKLFKKLWNDNNCISLLCDIKVFSTKLSLNNILHLRLSLENKKEGPLILAELNMLYIKLKFDPV